MPHYQAAPPAYKIQSTVKSIPFSLKPCHHSIYTQCKKFIYVLYNHSAPTSTANIYPSLEKILHTHWWNIKLEKVPKSIWKQNRVENIDSKTTYFCKSQDMGWRLKCFPYITKTLNYTPGSCVSDMWGTHLI